MKIVYYAPLNDYSGYATASRNYVHALLNNGFDVQTVHLEIDGFDYAKFGSKDIKNEDIKLMLTKEEEIKLDSTDSAGKARMILKHGSKEDDIIINHLIPEIAHKIDDRFNVIIMSWETDAIPTPWVHKINTMDLCLVSCDANVQAYKRSGVNIPIVKIPLAFDMEKYKKEYEPLDIPELDNFKFKFYSIFQLTRKKALDILLKGYFTEFTGNDDVVLVLKAYANMQTDVDEIQLFTQMVGAVKAGLRLQHYPKVMIINEPYTDEEIMRLHATCDAYVMPSRAEGWSITHFDAMAMGKYPIATDWGGPTEFIKNNDNGRLLKYEMQPVYGIQHPLPYLYTGYENWAEPSVADLKVAMRESYKFMQQEKFTKYLDMHRIDHAEKFSIDKVGPVLVKTIKKHYDKWKENKSKVVVKKKKNKDLDLTVCIYAKNEEKHIEKCIKSALATGGKVILGDNMSTDKTREIAKKYDIKIVDVPENTFPETGFSGAYNFVADEADTKWVLNLLGDCYITNPEDVVKIIEAGKSDHYWVQFFRPPEGSTDFYGKHPSSIHGRLYEKDKVRYFGLAHEDLCCLTDDGPKKLPPIVADIHICHQNKKSYVTGPEDANSFDFSNPEVAKRAILTDYLLSKMAFNPELKYFVNSWWFDVYYKENKDRIHKSAKKIRGLFPTLPVEEWESRLDFKMV